MKQLIKILKNLRIIFFPENIGEKYKHFRAPNFKEGSMYYNTALPLILLMDYKTRPNWCPLWLVRLITYLATDWRMWLATNFFIYKNFYLKLTKGFYIVDWKTKWSEYDLRIHLQADTECLQLATIIEAHFRHLEECKKLQEKLVDHNIPGLKFMTYEMLCVEYAKRIH